MYLFAGGTLRKANAEDLVSAEPRAEQAAPGLLLLRPSCYLVRFASRIVRLLPGFFMVTKRQAMLSRSRRASAWIRDNRTSTTG